MIKKLLLTGVVLVAAQSTLSFAEESRIEQVVVYPYGATITRVSEIELSQGSNTVKLGGLVPGLDAEEVRVEVDSSSVEIGQVRSATRATREAIDQQVRDILENIEGIEGEIQQLEDSSKAAKLRLEFISGISKGYAKDAWFESAQGAADISSWKDALALIQTGSDDANELIRYNSQKKRSLNKDLSKLKRDLSNARGNRLAESEFEITLLSSRSQKIKLRLHYNQGESSWEPHYEARLNSDSGKLRLAQQAIIQQETDEDWNNVKLILSTSEPSGELEAPELYSEFLTLRQPYRNRSYGDIEEVVVEAEMASVSSLDSEKLADAGIENVRDASRASIGSFAVNYNIPGAVTVPNNSNDELTFDLSQFEFDVSLITQIAPRATDEAFLGAKFTYSDSLPMYSSDMTVFVDGIYVGLATMPDLLPETEAVLPMGQDRRIELKVASQGNGEDNRGIVRKRKTETTGYIYEVINRRNVPTDVEVFDWLPVASHSDIKISVAKDATKPTEENIENKRGVFVWRKQLAANESWEIRHGYSVSYPSKLILVEE